MEWLIIIPEPDEYLATARSLLAIVGSDRAYEVEAVTYPNRGFRVPADVAIEHVRRCQPPAESPVQEPKHEPVPVPESEPEPTPAPQQVRRTNRRKVTP